MDKRKFADQAKRAKNWIVDTTRDAIAEARQRHDDDLYDEGYDDGIADQRERDVKSVIKAFLELKVKDQDIYKLLSEYFGIDSISEASERLFTIKKSNQIHALRKYCLKEGMTNRDFRTYVTEHDLESRFADDERLLDMQPEKLKALLDKK